MGLKPDQKFSADLIKKIEYVHSDEFSLIIKTTDPDILALELITRKLIPWAKEKEIRLLQQDEERPIEVGKCMSLLFGRNVSLDNINEIISHITYTDLLNTTAVSRFLCS